MLTHTKSSISCLAAIFKLKADGYFFSGGDSTKKTEPLSQRLTRSKNSIHTKIAGLHKSIGKQAFMAALFLISATFLLADYSINESPNNYQYTYTFDDEMYTNYTAVNRYEINLDYDGSDRVGSTCPDEIINSYNGNDSVPINISLSGFEKGDYQFTLLLDKEKIVSQQKENWMANPISFITPSLSYGIHELEIEVSQDDTLSIISDRVTILNMEQDRVFENPFGDKIILYDVLEDTQILRGTALFIEGFDFSMGGESTLMTSIAQRWQGVLEDCNIAILRLAEPTRDMRDNAMSVLAATRHVAQLTASYKTEGTRLFGFSMGGVLARYSLAFAEEHNIKHYCTQFISLDSPQKGAYLSPSLQIMIKNLHDFFDGGSLWHFPWNLKNSYKSKRKMVNSLYKRIKSPAAKQLLRHNRWADPEGHTYAESSDNFLDFFSEINSEERNIFYPERTILNYNPADSLSKPGFPYKQNNIKCMSYINGTLVQRGDIGDYDELGDYDIDIVWLHDDYNMETDQYDFQPGSVLDVYLPSLNESKTGYDVDFNQWYAPTIVPTRSGMYLKTTNLHGSNYPGDQFDVSQYGDIVIPQGVSVDEYLYEFSHFDKLLWADYTGNVSHPSGVSDPTDLEGSEWNWIHGNSLPVHSQNIALAAQWSNDYVNRTTCYISGTVTGTDFSGITISAYVENTNVQLPICSEYNHVLVDGTWSIPYTLVKPSLVRLVFSKEGYVPSIRRVSIQYDDNCALNPSIESLSVHLLPKSQFIYVSKIAEQGSFQSITDAVDYLWSCAQSQNYLDENITIKVFPGTYNESINLGSLADSGLKYLTIQGIGANNVIISGNNAGINLVLHNDYYEAIENAVYNICNLKFIGCDNAIVFKDYIEYGSSYPHNQHLLLNINNCKFNDCGGSGNGVYTEVNASAVYFEGAGTIESCHFVNNHMSCSTDFQNVGAVYVCNDRNYDMELANCTFENNTGDIAGCVLATGVGEIVISDNTFKNNKCWGEYLNCFEANDLMIVRAANTKIINNIFTGSDGMSVAIESLYSDIQNALSSAVLFENNTISYAHTDPSIDSFVVLKFFIVDNTPIQEIGFRNNVFTGNNPDALKISKWSGFHPSVFEYNILHNVTTLESSFQLNFTDPSADLFNYQCDPELDSNYQPIWNATTMSPCIDAGIGEDEDGTPVDIGAIPAIAHRYWEYSFENQHDVDRWHWVSYPILNTINNDALKASEFFEELMAIHMDSNDDPIPTYLDEIDWVEEGDQTIIQWRPTEHEWSSNQTSHFVSSPQGYKIKLLQNAPDVVTLRESGLKTPVTTEFQIHGGVENWIGYFKEEPAMPHIAFASIWDDIVYIKAKNWSLQRANPIGDYYGMHGKVASLRFGDMVIIKTNNTHTFAWGSGSPEVPPIKADPKNFVYDEKQDYIPVYISIADSMIVDLKEIGLYVDGVCKGAVVVEDSLEQISAYVDSAAEINEGNVEFVLYYNDSKSMGPQMKSMKLPAGRLQAQYSQAGPGYPYFEITLSKNEMENIIPPDFALRQNYPNPFNPSTTITYALPKSGKVRLDIYNLKGQLVNTLVNQDMEAGVHSVVWNGTDKNKRAVASGVYFYRLSSPESSKTKRMLLMK